MLYCRLHDPLDILTTSNTFHYFRARRDAIPCAFDPPLIVDKIIVENRVS